MALARLGLKARKATAGERERDLPALVGACPCGSLGEQKAAAEAG